MAGGTVKYRHLSRDSAARKALLRGLVTQLVEFEHIHTTRAKAKEAQKLADKLITLAKRNNEPCRRSAQGILYVRFPRFRPIEILHVFENSVHCLWWTARKPVWELQRTHGWHQRTQTPHAHLPKLFGELRQRYLNREGGYTRVVRTEPKNTYDQGESAILEFVDGPRDSRFMITAKAVARDRLEGRDTTPVTAKNIQKVTQFRGKEDFEAMVRRFMVLNTGGQDPGSAGRANAEPKLAEPTEQQWGRMGAEGGVRVQRCRLRGIQCWKRQWTGFNDSWLYDHL
jgi:large subunit ribosomal protein L17